MSASKVVTLSASTARAVAVSSGLGQLEVVNIDGNDVVYVTARFSDAAESASAGVLPVTATVQGETTRVVPAVAGSSIAFETDDEDQTLAVVSLISPGTPTVQVSMFDTKRSGGGGGGGGGVTHDYTPYVFDANADDPDTVILATSPYAYYPLATDLADVAGGAHDATASIGTVTGNGPALTTKNVAGKSVVFTNGGGATFPPPTADMSAPAQDWAAVMVMQVDDYDSVGGNSALDGGFPFFSWCGTSPPKMGHCIGSTGDLIPWFDSNFGRLGNYVRTRANFALGEPHVLLINAPTAVSSVGAAEFWIDGVLIATCQRVGDGTDGTVFQVGRISGGGPYFGGIDFHMSNLATWDRSLTLTEIEDISASLLDAAMLANAWLPA